VKRGTWSKGPDLPGGELGGFGPAAAVIGGRLFVSIGDGTLYRLGKNDQWERVGRSSPRLVHRMVGYGRNALVVGGATDGDNSDLVEAIAVRP
jgi:hypothetical protein